MAVQARIWGAEVVTPPSVWEEKPSLFKAVVLWGSDLERFRQMASPEESIYFQGKEACLIRQPDNCREEERAEGALLE